MSRLLVFIPQIIGLMLMAGVTTTVGRILRVICKGSFSDYITSLNRMMGLCLSQFIGTGSFRNRYCIIKLQASVGHSCKWIGILTYIISCFTNLGSSVTDSNRNRTGSLTRL